MTVACRIHRVDPEKPSREAIEDAAKALRRGGLVAFPTETVYGLGANAFNQKAVRRIFEVKGRPPDNPLIVHISNIGMIRRVASRVSPHAERLARALWPGPLTIIAEKRPEVPDAVTAGLPTVAVRMPAHRVALSMIEAAGTPVAAPSANPSGRPSPTSGEHVIKDLDCMVDVILDAGETFFGVESTIVDTSRSPPVLLRPGPVSVETLRMIIGEVIVTPEARGLAHAERPLAPGMKYRHYSPDTPIVLVDVDPGAVEKVFETALREVAALGRGYRRLALLGPSELVELVSQAAARRLGLGLKTFDLGPARDPMVAARRLFHALRRLDESGVEVAVVIGFREAGVGLAIMNRLRKAAFKRVGGVDDEMH